MQNSIIDIAHEMEGSDKIESHVSFRGFINFLKDRRLNEKTFRIKYLDFVIHHFEHRLAGKDVIEPGELSQYDDLLEIDKPPESPPCFMVPMLFMICCGTR